MCLRPRTVVCATSQTMLTATGMPLRVRLESRARHGVDQALPRVWRRSRPSAIAVAACVENLEVGEAPLGGHNAGERQDVVTEIAARERRVERPRHHHARVDHDE